MLRQHLWFVTKKRTQKVQTTHTWTIRWCCWWVWWCAWWHGGRGSDWGSWRADHLKVSGGEAVHLASRLVHPDVDAVLGAAIPRGLPGVLLSYEVGDAAHHLLHAAAAHPHHARVLGVRWSWLFCWTNCLADQPLIHSKQRRDSIFEIIFSCPHFNEYSS